MTRQLSLFGAEASPPEPDDLAGLLIAGGELRSAEVGAQLSVVVNHPWRAASLVAECARRGLAATSIATATEHIAVRTAHSPLLRPLVHSWGEGSPVRVPPGFRMDGRVLRLWVIAQGIAGAGGYSLPLGQVDEVSRAAIGGALAAVGVVALLVTPRGGATPSYRIVGRRRLTRLAEMVGDPPKQAPVGVWPS